MSKFSQTMFSSARATRTLIATLGRQVVLLNVLVLGLSLALVLLYIVQVNRATTKGYMMRDLETRISELTLQNQKWEIQATEARSMAAISEKVPMLGLVKAETPTYVSPTDTVSFNR